MKNENAYSVREPLQRTAVNRVCLERHSVMPPKLPHCDRLQLPESAKNRVTADGILPGRTGLAVH
jgi:hypothetical protein